MVIMMHPQVGLIKTSAFLVLDVVVSDAVQLVLDDREKAFDSITSINYETARVSSISERKETERSSDGTLTYGEMTYATMSAILNRLQQHPSWPSMQINNGDGVFVDLGSGAGRPLFAAATLLPFKKCIGIEILESLHELAMNARKEYYQLKPSWHRKYTDTIALHCGSMFDLALCDWTKADVVLACSTCFTDDMFKQLAEQGALLKTGAILITLSEALPHYHISFELLYTDVYASSWGTVEIFCHRHL
jgi:SAM-dependent methyltransferase